MVSTTPDPHLSFNRHCHCVQVSYSLRDGEGDTVDLGRLHTVALTIEGELWVWGRGNHGQLGLGDEANRLAPTLVGAQAAFGGSTVLTVACGDCHSLVVTKDGSL